jgi:hypothetical protein
LLLHPDFLLVLVALASSMRLSLMKAAHAAASSVARQEIRGMAIFSLEFTEFPVVNTGTVRLQHPLGRQSRALPIV